MSRRKRGDEGIWFMSAMVQLPLVRQVVGVPVRTPEDVRRVCDDIAHMAQESFHVLALDAKNRLIGRVMTTLGIANSCLVHPREVFRGAILQSACSIVLVHNHPSGDPTPSAEDLSITRQLVEAGKILDIKVLDHVILGPEREGDDRPTLLSLREEGLCKF
jgi:DNA repair protein RadC